MGTLSIALALGWDKGLLACATQAAEKPRFRSLPARDLQRLGEEIAKKARQERRDATGTRHEAGGVVGSRRQEIGLMGLDSHTQRRSTDARRPVPLFRAPAVHGSRLLGEPVRGLDTDTLRHGCRRKWAGRIS
jgi:hypothetical protein